MKKQVRIISTILIVIMLVMSISSVVLASGNPADKLKGGTAAGDDELWKIGKTAVATIQVIGVVVAVVVLLILGIKYMIGSAEERAEYKKTMIPYVVGAILLFAATTLVNVIYNLVNGLNQA